MVTAVILLSVERKHINQVAEELAALQGFSEVYSVSGSYDIAAVAKLENNEELSDLVTNKLAHIDYITNTETMLAFKTYSNDDMGSMFNIGF